MSKAKITIEIKDDNSIKLETKGDVSDLLGLMVSTIMEDVKFKTLVYTAISCVKQINDAQNPVKPKIIMP